MRIDSTLVDAIGAVLAPSAYERGGKRQGQLRKAKVRIKAERLARVLIPLIRGRAEGEDDA